MHSFEVDIDTERNRISVDGVEEESLALDDKRPLLPAVFPRVQRTGVFDVRVLGAREGDAVYRHKQPVRAEPWRRRRAA